LEEISSSQGLYLYTGQHKHRINTYIHQTSMSSVGFESTIPVSERGKKVYALDRSATVTSIQTIQMLGNGTLWSPPRYIFTNIEKKRRKCLDKFRLTHNFLGKHIHGNYTRCGEVINRVVLNNRLMVNDWPVRGRPT
jgi:hypothetical protein